LFQGKNANVKGFDELSVTLVSWETIEMLEG
jgi:hypothetical protein